ncbi:histidine kinase [Micromonospora peucetia]|uniref:histidine kinase n=1 Tax=Micromonospora peucetia TaxID=47871 RepID=A0ABZ1E7N4_9ACTN|nr:histidine kinase [Micromonospora peucetia]MCX4388522.1 histidine kinase [Micromonospora peucetia]WSA30819.1 histidine kinase [Micromonospora peucetia]
MDATAPPPRRAPSRVRAALPWVGVALLPVAVLLAPTMASSRSGVGFGDWWFPERYLVPLLAVVPPAGLLRRRPVLALTLMLGAACVVTAAVGVPEPGYLTDIWYAQFLAIDLVVGLVAARRSRRVSVPVAVVALVVQIAAGFVNPSSDPVNRATFSMLAVVTAWTVGNSVRARRGYAEAVRAHTAAEAVTAERLRIARELHDMVAHSIGVIAIQAGVGARVIDTQPAQARAALATIEATSRETLAGLRRTLGALRRPQPESASLDPTPGLDDLDRLVVAAADAGVRVDLRRDGERRPLPADLDLAAFRIVQEGLTNVVRHAGTDRCLVTVTHGPDEIAVEVVDDGRGGTVGGEGHGLVGMRERVDLAGGRFHAGPRPEGGFRVAAWLPVPPASPTATEPVGSRAGTGDR